MADPATRRRCASAPAVAGAVIVAIALRLPTATSRAVIGYDDGVYLASVRAVRDGGAPFRDVFSSQGPAFLPLLRLGDLLCGNGPWGPRLVPVAAAGVIVVLVAALARRVSDQLGAVVAASLAGTSGALLFSTSRIESDGIAVAFAAGGILAASAGGRRRSLAGGCLLGVAIAIKSLLVAPAALALLVLVVRRRGRVAALEVLVAAAAVPILLSFLWGIDDVWEQFVALHLDARHPIALPRRATSLWHDVWRVDRLLVAALAVGAVAALGRGGRGRALRDGSHLALAAWVWLAGAVGVLLLHAPLFPQHLTAVVVPAALVVARLRPPWWALAGVAAILGAGHGAAVGWRTSPRELTPSQAAAVRLLEGIEPTAGLVITDEPTLLWLADRASPGQLVDPSHVRIDAGQLDAATVADAAEQPGVCAVLLWSGRLDDIRGLRAALAPDYRDAWSDGDRRLLLRAGCTSEARTGKPLADRDRAAGAALGAASHSRAPPWSAAPSAPPSSPRPAHRPRTRRRRPRGPRRPHALPDRTSPDQHRLVRARVSRGRRRGRRGRRSAS